MGIPAVETLFLNKFADIGATIGATKNYSKSKDIDWNTVLFAIWPVVIGGFLGAKYIVDLPEELIKSLVIFGVITAIVIMVFPFKLKRSCVHSLSKKIFTLFVLFLIGIWGGALGMGGGTFMVLAFTSLLGLSFVRSAATMIIVVLPQVVIAGIIFYMAVEVEYGYLAAIFIGNLIGSFVGSKMAIRIGDKVIKLGIVFIALLMLLKVIVDF